MLTALLEKNKIHTALIVDDVFDEKPTASDIGPENEAWTIFNDDISPELRTKITETYPAAAGIPFDQCITDDSYVATIWSLREELGKIAADLFENYLKDQKDDLLYVQNLKNQLEALNLTVSTSGRDFANAVPDAQLIIIDLFLDKAQDSMSIQYSKNKLREALRTCPSTPPLVILMSRSPRLDAKREEFRDEVGLLDSGFRILKKDEINNTDRLSILLERLTQNRTDSLALARLFHEFDIGAKLATDRTLRLLRKLRLSDIGQIQQLLLNGEGQPIGSYFVDVFDRVFRHEIERETGMIEAAIALNSFSTEKYPPPYLAGSPDLQELVQRFLSQNESRLRLPASLGSGVAFGDILQIAEGVSTEQVIGNILVDLTPENVVLVLTPACDLQRGGAPRILLLIGTVKPLTAKNWTYGTDARTAAIRIGEELCWIQWDLKHIDTVSNEQLNRSIKSGCIHVVGRLREGHALELQQRVLTGLGRVGQIAALPATFAVRLSAFYPNTEGKLQSIPIDALSDGAVCFVGRDSSKGQALRLVVTETVCDELLTAIGNLQQTQVAKRAWQAVERIKISDFRQIMNAGLDLKNVGAEQWKKFGDPPLGLLAWNYEIPDTPLSNGHLSNAGIVLLIQDTQLEDSPGLKNVKATLVD